MNYTELQDRLKFVLDFNDTQTDGAFTAARIKQALNMAYEREVNKANEEGSQRYFKGTVEFVWPSAQLTYQLTPPLSKRGLIRITDVTESDPGRRIVFSENGLNGDVFWKDRNTMQWGTQGPGANRTLRAEYFAKPWPMDADDDEPDLIPEQFHELLVWSAAVFLRTVADESPPMRWVSERDEFRIDFWKYLSRGRPMSDVPTVSNTYPDSEVGFSY
jgi:hypothetical protein